jgi:hypothetical protein
VRPIEPPAFVGTVRVVMRGPEGVEDLVVRLEPAAARYLSVWELTIEERVAVIGGGNIVLSVIGAQPPVGMYVLEVGDGGE